MHLSLHGILHGDLHASLHIREPGLDGAGSWKGQDVGIDGRRPIYHNLVYAGNTDEPNPEEEKFLVQILG